MSYISIAILSITILCLGLGILFGFLRGRNRSLLRLGLVVVSAISAFFLKNVFVNTIMNINIQGQSIREMIVGLLNDGVNIPTSIQNMALTLVEIICGILLFIITFLLLKFLTWAIIFPICKIFVKRESVVHAWQGILIGGVQGFLIAFLICVPITGMTTQIDKLSQIQYQGESLFIIPEEIGVHEYTISLPAKLYHGTGHWFFEVLSTKEDANGNKIAITDVCDIAVTVADTADVLASVSKDLENIDFTTATPQEKVDSMKKLGDSLIKLGTSVDGLSDDAKILVQETLQDAKTMFADDEGNVPEEVEKLFDNINVEDLKLDSAGEAMNGIATYIEKTSDEFDNNEPVTQEEVNNIINGLADNTFILDMLVQEDNQTQLINIHEEDKTKFEQAIANFEMSDEYKNMLNQMFGLKE